MCRQDYRMNSPGLDKTYVPDHLVVFFPPEVVKFIQKILPDHRLIQTEQSVRDEMADEHEEKHEDKGEPQIEGQTQRQVHPQAPAPGERHKRQLRGFQHTPGVRRVVLRSGENSRRVGRRGAVMG